MLSALAICPALAVLAGPGHVAVLCGCVVGGRSEELCCGFGGFLSCDPVAFNLHSEGGVFHRFNLLSCLIGHGNNLLFGNVFSGFCLWAFPFCCEHITVSRETYQELEPPKIHPNDCVHYGGLSAEKDLIKLLFGANIHYNERAVSIIFAPPLSVKWGAFSIGLEAVSGAVSDVSGMVSSAAASPSVTFASVAVIAFSLSLLALLRTFALSASCGVLNAALPTRFSVKTRLARYMACRRNGGDGMKKTAELKMLPVGVLKPAAYNPRKKLKPGDKEYEKIKASIEEYGFADPLVVNKDMTIIGGHQRLTVAMALGYTEVPCAVVDIDKTREKALNIALNKITGAWDDTMLADLLKDIEASDFDLAKTGFDAPEIETLFNKVHSKEVKEDDFNVESELKRPAFSMPGDLWLLGRHRVFCGDSTKPESYELLMDGQKANLVLSDPPYNVDVEETAGKIMNDNMGDSEFYEFLLSAYQQMHENLADDGSIYIFHADTEGLNFRKAFKEAGFYLSGCCIWKKNALVLGRSPYQWQHEPCLYGWKQKGKHQCYSDRKQTTIWEYDRPKANKDHPTMKPVGLMSYPIRNSTMTNGIVLDPFLGSGSTLIACEETERVCRGIELDTKFMDVIVKRYIEYKDGNASDVSVIRSGQRLTLDEVLQLQPEADTAGEQDE